ncbi:MAG: UvrD-helicase domain-containing protein, partial [Bacteroides sp.]|nr:UvrD-helicase domain-containing protein [Bacteroides sp.]
MNTVAEMNFTSQQRAAIDDRGGDLLVSAAAGSGKTRVLVERLMDQVEAGADVRQFLIITYTRAAAAELRGRILDEIGRRSALRPSRHLRRQTALVYQADIGTIHAFCSKAIREFAHVLEISPDFRTADEGEARLILNQVLEDVLEERYGRMDDYPGFAALVDTVSAGRNDSLLADTVLETHTKLMSHPYPEDWAARRLEELDVSGLRDAGETAWGDFLLRRARGAVGYWLREMADARSQLCEDDKLERAYGPSWDETLDGLHRLWQALEVGWDAAHAVGDVPFPRPKPVGGFEELKALRRRCKTAVDKLTADLALDSKQLFADLRAVQPVVRALVDLVLDLERAYSREKTRRGLLDFADLEHLAVRLLVDRETGGPTARAGELAGRYREVMVDEFQDVSGIQDMIFRALGEYGPRRFMVGDVKQSIYRFRLADPTIFLGYYRRFADGEEAEEGQARKVLLGKNFRSRPGILDAVNFLFRRIMSEPFGEMDYGDREALYPGLGETEGEDRPVELAVLDLQNIPDDGGDGREMAEARYVARRIRTLHDEEGYSWGDFAILLRSVRGKGARFERALEELDIPVAKRGGEAFFYTAEVASILSLLSIVVNPLQDVPLISVLRSPLFCFTPDELAEIRSADRSVSFYEAMVLAAETNARCARFLADLSRFRDAAPDMSAEGFLWYIFSETAALSVFGAMAGGEMRRRNLISLLSYARKVEAGGYRGLFSFVSLQEKRMETGDTPELAAPVGGGDTVHIMSGPKSQGRELPVVVLPEL